MQLYLVARRNAWRSDEELAAAADCLPSVTATLAGEVRWIRSYVVRDADGELSAYCLYEAVSEDALRRHSDAAMLPTTGIEPVHATVVAAPDPEPVTA